MQCKLVMTTRKRSYGKVMFLHLSFCSQGEGCHDITSCYGHNPPPPYGQQVGGTHPTGMLSCLAVLLKRNCPIGVIVL